jgi:hypothetical protein
MANTLGTFTKLDDGVFTGTFKTLHFNGPLTIVPVDKMSEGRARSPGLCRSRATLRGRGRLEPGREIERRDLRQPQDRRSRIRAAHDILPAGQARKAGRRRRHPHDPVGTAQLRTTAPSRVTAAGLFRARSIPSLKSRTGAPACPSGIRLAGFSIVPCRTGPPQGCAVPPILPSARGAPARASSSSRSTKSAPPRPAARRLRRP